MPREQDHEKFKELARKRVRRAIKDIKLIGNLANRSNYFYTEEDAGKIVKALNKEIQELKAKFERRASEEPIDFDL